MNKELIHVNCNFCNSKKYRYYDEWDGFTIVKCTNCGYCYTNPRPAPEQLKDFYNAEYFKDQRFGNGYFSDSGQLITPPVPVASIQMIEHYLERRGRILEIGAAFGHFLNQLKKLGWEVEGIEISEDAVRLARELYGLELYCGELSTYQTDKKFDVAYMNQTLEHVPDPKYIIKRCHDLLKENGILLIEVPNLNAFDIKFDRERRRLSYDLPRHLSHFTPAFLKKELRRSGFKVLETDRFYPKFILEFQAKKHAKYITDKNQQHTTAGNIDGDIQLYRKKYSLKGRILKQISLFFPGWKFTITAQKKH